DYEAFATKLDRAGAPVARLPEQRFQRFTDVGRVEVDHHCEGRPRVVQIANEVAGSRVAPADTGRVLLVRVLGIVEQDVGAGRQLESRFRLEPRLVVGD